MVKQQLAVLSVALPLVSSFHHFPHIIGTSAPYQWHRLHSAPVVLQGATDSDNDEPAEISTVSSEASPQERILQWASVQPDPAYLSPSLRVIVRDPSEGGAGLFVCDDIPFNETLAVLPFDYNCNDDAKSNATGKGFRLDANTAVALLNEGPVKTRLLELIQDGSKTRLSSALAGAIAHLHLVKLREEREQRSDQSLRIEQRFGPFLDVLPLLPSNNNHHPFPSHVLFWTDDQISMLLANTLALTKARFARAQAGEHMGAVSTAFVMEHCPKNNMKEILEAKDAIISAFACVQSRTFEGFNVTEVHASGSETLMIPFLDLLNHAPDDERNARHAVDDDRNAAILLADRDINAGEEILINYGKREAWDWGTKYAFVPHKKQMEDTETESITVALPLFPRVLCSKEGVEIDLTTKGENGMKATNAIRLAMEATEESDSDPLMLAELFLPEERSPPTPSGSPLSALPAKQVCVIITGTTESGTSPESVKSRAMPIFRAAEYIIKTLFNGEVIDEDTVCSSLIAGLTGDESASPDCVVDDYISHLARQRYDMLQIGLNHANAWASTATSLSSSGGKNGDYMSLRLQLANDMRQAELSAMSKFIESLKLESKHK